MTVIFHEIEKDNHTANHWTFPSMLIYHITVKRSCASLVVRTLATRQNTTPGVGKVFYKTITMFSVFKVKLIFFSPDMKYL